MWACLSLQIGGAIAFVQSGTLAAAGAISVQTV